jgi:addiction module HigA family antidote
MIHPGEILPEEFMRPLGISINRLAHDIAVPPNRISEIVRGKRSADYDLRVVRRSTWPREQKRVAVHGD